MVCMCPARTWSQLGWRSWKGDQAERGPQSCRSVAPQLRGPRFTAAVVPPARRRRLVGLKCGGCRNLATLAPCSQRAQVLAASPA